MQLFFYADILNFYKYVEILIYFCYNNIKDEFEQLEKCFMYLKRLELQGFKSFPEKIRLEFNKGITAVVGPNGSGKSNIADAVRWVLGEKSAKSLRGSKMEDVIFNGTANRKPLGFAEVSMVMDNSDKKLNIDFSEVTVTRRVFRSGESDYLINGSKCRAKDILELFMDTGVGKEGYSIIGQGRIDEILSSKSEDRRTLFEEAAGIVKYRTRSSEAQNKLSKERENLVRVNDIIAELETQVGPLEIAAEKAKKAIILTDKMKLVRVNIFVRDAEKYESEIKNLDTSISQIQGDIDTEVKKEEENNNNIALFKNNLVAIENNIEDTNNKISDNRSALEQKENDIRLIDNEIEHCKSNISRINDEVLNNKNNITEKRNKIENINTTITAKKIELETKQKLYGEKLEAFSKLSSKVQNSEDLLSQYNSEIINKMNLSTDIKGEISRKTAMIEQLKVRQEQILSDLNTLSSHKNERQIALEAATKELQRANKAEGLSKTNIDKMTSQLNKLNTEINSSKDVLSNVNKSIQDKNARLKILSELEKSYEGYYGGVKAVLSERDKKNPLFRGVFGAVGELINMQKDYETAIEIALGSAVQNIVTGSEEDTKKAISFLKSSGKGRATFLPMTAIKPKTLGAEKYKIINEPGVVGIAKELISYSSEYENIMSSLLERVIVVDNIDNGIKLANKTKYAYKIVTLEGELLNAGGSITGGSLGKKSAGIFSRGREISSLKESLKDLYEEQMQINSDVAKMVEIIENVDYKINEAKEDLQSIAIRKTEAINKKQQAEEYLQDIEGRAVDYNNELNNLKETIDAGNKDIEDNNKSLDAVNNEINDINDKLDSFQTQIQSDRDIREESNKEISAIRVELNQLENDVYSLNSDISRIEREIAEIEDILKNADTDIEEINNTISDKNSKRNSIYEEIKTLSEKQNSLKELSEKLINDKNDLNEKINQLNSQIIKQLETKSSLEKELNRLELRREQADNKSRQLYDSMWDEYEMTYVMAKDYEKLDMSDSDLQKEERKLRNEIRALGNVNLNAVDEYRAVKERYDFLTQNRDDIIETEKKLVKVIEQLENLMEKQFSEQFKTISQNFSDTFAEMFGGGNAELKLSDDNDILNCGIDIIVQPPGKALQNMMLLSGGEKALTAMALLFAILKMKPSPFCILDEIEAALDDANVNRYAEYLSNFTDDTQFVVITHRKGTMEAADILYGVTMQEQGVSKLVSVKFDESREAM